MTVIGVYIDEVQDMKESVPEICRFRDVEQYNRSRKDMISWLGASKQCAMNRCDETAQQNVRLGFWRRLFRGMPQATRESRLGSQTNPEAEFWRTVTQ